MEQGCDPWKERNKWGEPTPAVTSAWRHMPWPQSKEGTLQWSMAILLIWRDRWEFREVDVPEIVKANHQTRGNHTEKLVQKFAKLSPWIFGGVLIYECERWNSTSPCKENRWEIWGEQFLQFTLLFELCPDRVQRTYSKLEEISKILEGLNWDKDSLGLP